MADPLVLDAAEQRVLGALMEKQRTVPATYPLSLNALRSACNQTTSREPVTDYAESELEAALAALRSRGLVRVVWAETGRRTLKYHHLLDEVLELRPDQRALITVLLLRGPQAPGELKTRTERLHPFRDREEVEDALRELAQGADPLVRELPRRPGHHDARWIHLLGPVATGTEPDPGEQGPDLEAVLRDGPEARDRRVVSSYDAIAAASADHPASGGRPAVEEWPAFEEWLLNRLAGWAGSRPVVDVGCGAGHLAARLARSPAGEQIGVSAIDLSPGMVAEARRRYPDLDVTVGDLRTLLRPRNADGWGVVVAWRCLAHFAPSELPGVCSALGRTLAAGGTLLLAVDVGPDLRHRTSAWGVPIDLDQVSHDLDHVLSAVGDAGLQVAEWYVRGTVDDDDPGRERAYVVARRSDPA